MGWLSFYRRRGKARARISANQRAGVYNLRVMMCDDAKKATEGTGSAEQHLL